MTSQPDDRDERLSSDFHDRLARAFERERERDAETDAEVAE